MENEEHNQKLRQSAIDKVIEAYSNDPVTYPGATRSGITLSVDAGSDSTITPGGGKWGSLSRAKAIPWAHDFTTGARGAVVFKPYEELVKTNFLPTGRGPIFHYDVIVAELSKESGSTSGWTPHETVGPGSIISLGDWTGGVGSEDEQAGTFMHELGHVLGLLHCGEAESEECNHSPNFPSVMNYSYQMFGVARSGKREFDYSRSPEEALNEKTLTEKTGFKLATYPTGYGMTWICPGGFANFTYAFAEVDWSCDGKIDGGTGFDVNGFLICAVPGPECTPTVETEVELPETKRSDWERMKFKTSGVGTGNAAAGLATFPGTSEAVDEINREMAAQVRIPPRITYTGAVGGDYHDPVTAAARLVDPTTDNSPVVGATITFMVGTSTADTCTASTGSTGVASCTIRPSQAAGPYEISASFAGDETYQPASATHDFTIAPEETTMTYTGPTVILAGGTEAKLTAKMIEDGSSDNDADGGSSAPVPSETVTLAVGTQTCQGTTDAAGNVSCTIPSVTVPLGPETVGAAFAGDAYYSASSDSKTATVFAFPSQGAFLLGDKTVALASATTLVTWWAGSWSSLDSVSAGHAPSAFKGFASHISLPTTTPAAACASNWTATGGDSESPPSSVPAYMGTVVTSQVTQSGATISGNAVKIVVVKTNPGYAPQPGHNGTGTIVATYC